MQAFIVRPVFTGLLALIIAGLSGLPLGGRSAVAPAPSCHAPAPAAGGAMIRHGARC